MDTKTIIAVILLVCVVLSGCVEKECDVVATYRCETGSMLHLFSDNRYIDNPVHSTAFHGNYRVIGDKMYLEYYVLGTSACFVMVGDGKDFIDEDGDRWVRE